MPAGPPRLLHGILNTEAYRRGRYIVDLLTNASPFTGPQGHPTFNAGLRMRAGNTVHVQMHRGLWNPTHLTRTGLWTGGATSRCIMRTLYM